MKYVLGIILLFFITSCSIPLPLLTFQLARIGVTILPNLMMGDDVCIIDGLPEPNYGLIEDGGCAETAIVIHHAEFEEYLKQSTVVLQQCGTLNQQSDCVAYLSQK